MSNYSLSLDLSGGKDPEGYFPISVVSVEPFKQQQVDGMLTMRLNWGAVTIKNEPYKYAKLGESRYKLFDIISSFEPTQEMHIKFVSDYQTIIGYFGLVDCKINEDESIIILAPTIQDQYTAFLENRDEDIDLYSEENLIANGEFKDGINYAPESWVFDNWEKSDDHLFLEKKYLDGKSIVALSDSYVFGYTSTNFYADTEGGTKYTHDTFIYVPRDVPPTMPLYITQTVKNILAGRQINLSFGYYLVGVYEESKKFNLKFRVTLYDRHNPLERYGLIDDSKGDLVWTNSITAPNPLPFITYTDIPLGVSPLGTGTLKPYKKTIAQAPITGDLKIEFYRLESVDWQDDVKLVLSNIELTASAIELKTVNIEFNDEALVTFPQGAAEIYWDGKRPVDAYFQRTPSDQREIADYFNADGNPNSPSRLNDRSYGITSETNTTYANLAAFFDDINSKSALFEISELTVYKGVFRSGNKRKWYATARFSREEIKTADIYVDGVLTPQIPAENAGWVNSGKVVDGKRLWIRKPFNDTANQYGWTLGVVDIGDLRDSGFGFKYYDKQTTTKNYPVSIGKSREITNAIDLRELFNKLYRGANKALIGKQVYSSFLWNDPQNSAITTALKLEDGINYVTNLPNELNRILAIHTADIPKDEKSNTDSILKTSPKKFIDDFMVLFPQTYWFIDPNGDLWIEHIKFFDKVNQATSLLEPKYNYIKNYRSWEYAKAKMFATEIYTTVNSGYDDFKSTKITFDKIASNKRSEDIKGTYATQILTTDIQYCCENSDSLDNGIILVSYDYDPIRDINVVGSFEGQKSGKLAVNGQLCLATLLAKYATYEGTWYQGLINDKQTRFENTRRSRQGSEITVKGIFTPDITMSDLGIGVGIKTFDYTNQLTKVVAMYRYQDLYISLGGDTVIDMGETPPVAFFDYEALNVSFYDPTDFNFTFTPEETTRTLTAALVLTNKQLIISYGITHINWIVKRDGIVVGNSHNTIVYSETDSFHITCDLVLGEWGDGESALVSEMYFANNQDNIYPISNIGLIPFTATRLAAIQTNTTPQGIITDAEITTGVDMDGNYNFTLTVYRDVYQLYYGAIYVNAEVYDENNTYMGVHTISSGDYDSARTFSGNVGIPIGYGYVINIIVSY